MKKSRNELGEKDALELKRFAEQGNKLKWTWIIGTMIIIACVLEGDTAQWLFAVLVAVYMFVTTINYFKPG